MAPHALEARGDSNEKGREFRVHISVAVAQPAKGRGVGVHHTRPYGFDIMRMSCPPVT